MFSGNTWAGGTGGADTAGLGMKVREGEGGGKRGRGKEGEREQSREGSERGKEEIEVFPLFYHHSQYILRRKRGTI